MCYLNMNEQSNVKRYTEEQRKEILSFIDTYNAENRRGGQSAATKKYCVTALTLASWAKKSGQTKGKIKSSKRILERLEQVKNDIVKTEKRLTKLQAEANQLRLELTQSL